MCIFIYYWLHIRVHVAALAVARCPVCNGGGEVGSRRSLYYFSVQCQRLCLVGIERGEQRGEVAGERHGLRAVAAETDLRRQLLRRACHTQEAHRCRPFTGIRPGGDFRERQCHVGGCAMRAVIHIERGGGSRKVTFNAFYPVGCAACRFDDKRKLPHLLLHGGGQFILGIFFDGHIHSAREQPTGRGSHERARAVPITGSCGNGSGCTAYRDLFRCVIDIGTVCSRLEQVVYPVCRVAERGRVGARLHRVGCGDVDVRAPLRPVGGKGYRAVVGVPVCCRSGLSRRSSRGGVPILRIIQSFSYFAFLEFSTCCFQMSIQG